MTVKEITVGVIAGKPGRNGTWGVKIDNTDTWLNFKDKPTFGRGAVVKVEADGERNVSRFKVVSAGQPQGSGGGGGGFKKGGGFKTDPAKDERITMQHSQEMAILAADLILTHDAEKLGAKTKVQERKAAILSLIDELTARFFADAYEQNSLKAAKEVADDLGDDDFGDEDAADDGFGEEPAATESDDDLWE